MEKNEVRWIRLGELIKEVDERNSDLFIHLSQGISNQKYFQDPKQVSSDSRSDKIVRKGQFAYNRATTRNGGKISIAYREGPDCTVSSAYGVFYIIDETKLNPYYLLLWFKRPEFDRYARFKSKGSAHEFFSFDDMCDVQIPMPFKDGIPDSSKQKAIVDAWQGLQKLHNDNARLVEPLMQLCRSYMEDLKKRLPLTSIAPYINRQDRRNNDNRVKIVKSVSVKKVFNDTNAKVDKNNLSSYKVVLPNQLSFVQTTHNEKCLCIAVNRFDYPVVVTSVNEVFSTDEEVLLPDFLYLFFTRKEFDRYARFHSWGSARETFDWNEMCQVKIPIPSTTEQRAIVDIFMCAERAKHIAEEADRLSREICPALMQHIIHEND